MRYVTGVSAPRTLVKPLGRADTCSTAMFSLNANRTTLPQNAEVHVKLRWHRVLGVMLVPAPAIVVDNRRPHR